MTDIWDIKSILDEEGADIWEAPRNVVGPDVIEELGLTTTVYSGAWKRAKMNRYYTVTTSQGGRGSFFVQPGNVKRTLKYYENEPGASTLLLKGTITWEIVDEP